MTMSYPKHTQSPAAGSLNVWLVSEWMGKMKKESAAKPDGVWDVHMCDDTMGGLGEGSNLLSIFWQ